MSKPRSATRTERLILLGSGCGLAAAVAGFVAFGAEIGPDIGGLVRFLLALVAAVFGAFLPGAAFGVDYAGRGLLVRAGGASAMFLLVWLAGPSIGGVGGGLIPELRP